MKNTTFLAYMATFTVVGWFIGVMTTPERPQAQNIKAEYYLELKRDGSAVLEDIGGNTYYCPKLEDIPVVLERDNL